MILLASVTSSATLLGIPVDEIMVKNKIKMFLSR